MRQLAKPKPNMFDSVKKSAFEQLSAYLTLFSKTPTYKSLGSTLNDRIERSEKAAAVKKSQEFNVMGSLGTMLQGLVGQ